MLVSLADELETSVGNLRGLEFLFVRLAPIAFFVSMIGIAITYKEGKI